MTTKEAVPRLREGVSALAEYNGIENPVLTYVGQFLTIPVNALETILQKDDWFYQNAIPIRFQRNFTLPMVRKNTQSGKIARGSEVPLAFGL